MDDIFNSHSQCSIMESLYPTKKITKKIRLIEFFAGIGSQLKALKLLGANVEHYKICEWAYNSILSYNAIHLKDFKNYSEGKTKEEMIDRIRGISVDYNVPLTDEQLNRKCITWIRKAYNNCVATSNLINIMDVKGEDLEVKDTDKYEYILTYSFPCQDLSNAGKRQGMAVSQADGGTRSGLLWEVERILTELKNKDSEMPQILLMENVPDITFKDNVEHFNKWILSLERLGYTNYYKILNGIDYGIAQARQRCFMISFYGQWVYNFPRPFKIRHLLKDFLNKKVDKKYYVSAEKLQKIAEWKSRFNPIKNIAKEREYVHPITARGAGEEHSGMILIDESLFEEGEMVDLFASEEFRHIYGNEVMQVLPTRSRFGKVEKIVNVGNVGNGHHTFNVYSSEGLAPTITTGNHGSGQLVQDFCGMRIRKILPVECFRLMGFEDSDEKVLEDIGMSDNAIYHMAGDSIITTCLMAIFSPLIYDEKKHIEIINDYVEKLVVK